MSAPPKNDNRVEAMGHRLEHYTPENNPEFLPRSKVFYATDPRLAAEPKPSPTSEDQSKFAGAYKKSARHWVDRINASPDLLTLEYPKGPRKDSQIMLGSASIKFDGRPIDILTPFACVVATTVRRDVCTTYTSEMKQVEVGLHDHDTLIRKTNWETTLSARAIPDDPNKVNREFLEFGQAMRELEVLVVRRLADDIRRAWDADKQASRILPELVTTDDMTGALDAGNSKAFAKELLKTSVVSVVKQQKLRPVEKAHLKRLYKEANGGQNPSADLLDQGMSVLWGSDKVTVKTKQFQQRRSPDLGACTPSARAICEANPGTQWIAPSIVSAKTGSRKFKLKDDAVHPGDVVAVQFNPSFIVYSTKNEVMCGLSLLWTTDMHFYQKRADQARSKQEYIPVALSCADAGEEEEEEDGAGAAEPAPKRIRLDAPDADADPQPPGDDDLEEY